MSLDLLDLAPGYRPVDWRWRVAEALAKSPPPWPRGIDGITLISAGLLRSGRLERPTRFELHNPAVAAQRIARHPARPTMEALLLTGLRPDAIGRPFALPGRAIAAFADLFYDVRERLGDRGYVLSFAVDSKSDDPGERLKFFALQFGSQLTLAACDLTGTAAGDLAGAVQLFKSVATHEIRRAALGGGRELAQAARTTRSIGESFFALAEERLAEVARGQEQFVAGLLEIVNFTLAGIDSPPESVEIPDELRERLGTPPMRERAESVNRGGDHG